MPWQVLRWLFLRYGVKCILARWLMPSPKSKKQICSWQSFVTLCQVSCAESQGNGNTKHFLRRNTNNILQCNIYVSSCQGGTAASWGPMEKSHSRAWLEACEVGWLFLSFLPVVTCSAMGLVTVPKEREITVSEAEHLQKENAFRWAKPPLLPGMKEGQCMPSGPYAPRLWWRAGGEGVPGWRTAHRGVTVLSSSRDWVGVSAWVLLLHNQERWRQLHLEERKPESLRGPAIIAMSEERSP